MPRTTGTVPLTLRVNGVEHKIQVKPRHTLLEVLRDDLGLTGAKRGCDDGTCGTCTVTANGRMARACRVSLRRAEGLEVVTIEGLGGGLGGSDRLHPLQEAFIEADAVQCGFCTPGMILAAKALLDRNPAPTRPQIVKALGGNLCRCTGYVSIVDAIARVAGGGRGDSPEPARPPGETHPRDDARDKVLGTALYAADLTMEGMLHGAILRSPHPHADVVSIDDTEARAVPGVVAVVTEKDVPGPNRYGRAVKDQPVLADGRVRQIGDPVAAVAATSPEAAAQAVSLLRVTYKPLPAVLDPAGALEENAPQIHESGNLLSEGAHGWGDVEAGLAEADLVVEETYTTPWIEQGYLEPDAVLAYVGDGGVLVVRTSTQYSFMLQKAIAENLALPEERVQVLPTVVGGAFGGKNDATPHCIVALLALKTGRPVKLVYTRAETFAFTYKRHPFRIHCRTGVKKNGRLTALDVEFLADTGAYAHSGPAVFVRSGLSLGSPYRFANASIRGKTVYTNNIPAGSMRGFGAPQAVFAIESQMDIMAAKLGLDPLKFREMNRRRSDPTEATPQQMEQEAAYQATIDAVRPYYLEALQARQAKPRSEGRWRRGVGMASMRYGVGSAGRTHDPGRVDLELGADGNVRVRTGLMELGQGSDTVWQLIVAQALGLPQGSVSVVSGDTAVTPDSGTTGGSRATYYVGNAAWDGAVKLKEAILSTASEMLEGPAEDLELKDGRVTLARGNGSPEVSVSLAQVAEARLSARLPLDFNGVFDAAPLIHELGTGEMNPFPVYVSATHLAEVEVSPQGEVRVLRIVAAHDVGRAVFPEGLKGQIEGAVAMGLGFALKEEYRPGETAGFKQYRIPTARELPEVVIKLVELVDPSAGLGAKGAAECALVPVAPAIANAIADATGARIHDLPATPQRLRALLD
ncbi:MAG: molybdopterin-dependent oxidoreductase [Dehalococcoidia bacterium]|nr:molybdopterin-dependent oxidoreductase [Dehalococcoidia bacterium]MDP7201411.1 molybdopterin-dependent oxidoreductase [Dehalococcoidia bacterium]MDP7511915.1 molybdopterin-dependent oxidoreductase [Dehalococcoidia bacterium]HJN85522.1 molybdopterin cofactor-binding domain-containing protein [Dehalococcoidia bacterium]